MAALRFAVFDCDGTLVDSQHAIHAGMEHVWALEGLTPPDRASVRRTVGLPLLQAMMLLHPEGEDAQHRRMADSYRDAFHDPSIQLHDEEPLFENCAEILEALVADGVFLAVATGKGRRGLDATLRRHGLSGHFTVLKTADDGPGKPHPAILEDAMREVGADPRDTVMIGDTIFDMQLAMNAKTHGVGVSWGYHDPEELTSTGAVAVADHFNELPEILNRVWSTG